MALNKAQLMETPGGPGVVGAVQAGTGITITGGVISVNPSEAVTQIVAGDNITLTPADGRGVVTISSTGGGGGGQANPTPGNTQVSPAFSQGDGTQGNPFVVTPATVNIGGAVQSAQLITFSGLTAGQQVIFQDLNSATNGNRFAQPTGTVSGSGTYTFRLQFNDIPATTGGGIYTAALKCGTATVYFRWAVTVSTSGIVTPAIETIIGSDGDPYAAPTSPSYLTSSTIGGLKSVNVITGMAASAEAYGIPVLGGSGSGATVTVTSTSGGSLGTVNIITGGAGYIWDELVELDLSSIGGPSAAPFQVRTQPVSAGQLVATTSTFEGFNAGNFQLAEWQISTEPTFLSPTTITESSPPPSYTIPLPGNIQLNSPFYARVRFKSTTGLYSEYSPIIRGATGSAYVIEYYLQDVYTPGSPGVTDISFYSGSFLLPGGAGVSLLVSGPGISYAGITGPFCSFYYTKRTPLEVEVLSVGGNGEILSFRNFRTGQGLNDNQVGTTQPFTNVTGTGTGATFVITQNPSTRRTEANSLANAGTGYAAGNILKFIPADPNLSVTGGLDPEYDVLLHGMAQQGSGGTGAPAVNGVPGIAPFFSGSRGGGQGGSGGNTARGGPGGGGGSPSGLLFPGAPTSLTTPIVGQDGQPGGVGWGGGQRGQNGQNQGGGGGGGSGYTVLNTNFIPSGEASVNQYGARGVRLFINGVQTPASLITNQTLLFPLP